MFVNEIKSTEGAILVIGVMVFVNVGDQPIYASIRQIHQCGFNRTHTRAEVDKILRPEIAKIKNDYKAAPITLARDGNRTNDESTGTFSRYKGIQNIYCLVHLIAGRVQSLVSYPLKTNLFSFQSKDGVKYGAMKSPRATAKTTLLSEHLKSEQVKRLLVEMSRASKDDPLWTCLEESDDDPPDFKPIKRAIRLSAQMYDAALHHTVGVAKPIIKANLEISETLVFVPTQTNWEKKCWGTDATDTFRQILNCPEDAPLQMFTTCCDENIGDSASKVIDGQIHAAAMKHVITSENVETVISIFCAGKPISVHNSFGDFTRKVKFF